MLITQKYVNELAYKIVGCAIRVHKELGPGLLESVYEECFILECRSMGLVVERQKELNVIYKGIDTGKKFRLDVLVEDLIIIELKSSEALHPINQAQLLSHMNLAKKPKGLLINFNCMNIVNEGLVPLVNEYFKILPAE
ncbi:MAG: GxxExxY protein [Saprospiraceae bacterium]